MCRDFVFGIHPGLFYKPSLYLFQAGFRFRMVLQTDL